MSQLFYYYTFYYNYYFICFYMLLLLLSEEEKDSRLAWLGWLAGWWCERGNLKKVCFAFSGFSVAIIWLVV